MTIYTHHYINVHIHKMLSVIRTPDFSYHFTCVFRIFLYFAWNTMAVQIDLHVHVWLFIDISLQVGRNTYTRVIFAPQFRSVSYTMYIIPS